MSTNGPRTQQEALRLMALNLIGYLNATTAEEMFSLNMTAAQKQRLEKAREELARRLGAIGARAR